MMKRRPRNNGKVTKEVRLRYARVREQLGDMPGFRMDNPPFIHRFKDIDPSELLLKTKGKNGIWW